MKFERLGNKVTQIRGISYKPSDISENPKIDYVPVLKANNITETGLNTSNLIYIHKSKVRKEQFIKKGDLLLAASSGSKDIVGKNIYFENDFNGSFGAFCKLVRPNEKIIPEFLGVFFKTPYFKRHIRALINGALINNLKNEHIDSLKVPELPFSDQLYIANLLTKAENLIAQRKESIRLLDEFLKITFLEMFGDPKNNEKGFAIRNLTEFYINPKEGTKCGPFGSALKKDEYTETGIPVWTMDNILKTGEFNESGCLFVSEIKHKELERYNALNGDIIISRAGTVGKMCIIKTDAKKSVISSNLIRLRLGKDLLPIYFYSLMRYCQSRVIKLKHGNEDSYTHMSTGILDEINFPYPSIEFQTKFAHIVEKTELLKEQYQQSLLDLEALYGSLSQKAFRGELKNRSLNI